MAGSRQQKVLVIDVGGTHVKILADEQDEPVKLPSGPKLTPRAMAAAVQKASRDWTYSAISIGYPGIVVHGKPVSEPHNLGRGWVGFDYAEAFGCPVKVINDAAMQAFGSYVGGRMLFLGLGTGLGSALVVDGILEPMELAHLPYKHGRTYEDFIGARGMDRLGEAKWRRHVLAIGETLKEALQAEYVVLGGGNARLIVDPPKWVKLGENANAFVGGRRMWQKDSRS